MHNYKELKIWQRAVDLATTVYSITQRFPASELYGLTQQIRRAVVSVSSNIAEGAGRKTEKEFGYFLNMAYGSLYELETQLIISCNLGFLEKEKNLELQTEINELQKMIYVLIKKQQSLSTQY